MLALLVLLMVAFSIVPIGCLQITHSSDALMAQTSYTAPLWHYGQRPQGIER